MLFGNERLIVIDGVAHSGTTILAYILMQHLDVLLGSDGPESWILENSWLPGEKEEPIQQLLDRHLEKRLVLKRPWNCVRHADWMVNAMPYARYLYCVKSFEEIAVSWTNPGSFVDSTLRKGTKQFQRDHYDTCLAKAGEFCSRVPYFRQVEHAELLANPEEVISNVSTWLELIPFDYKISAVSPAQNIKHVLGRTRL